MLLLRVYRIFQRYADQNLRLSRRGRTLQDPGGAAFGEVTRIALARNRLQVEGWIEAGRVGLRLGRTIRWIEPDLVRPGSPRRGFALDVPFEPGAPELLAERPGGTVATPLPAFAAGAVTRARARLWLPFLAALVELAPTIWRWKRGGDLGAREVVKERLDLVARAHAAPMAPRIARTAPPARPFPRATVVLPVYNARTLLMEALDRVARHSDLDWRLVVIEDRSTDPALRPALRAWCADPARRARVTLLENAANLGFIGTVNRGFVAARAWPGDPVVLLNSDAMVPEGWLSRLLAPMADPSVASVTPMSNDAEIFTVPAICRRHDLAPGTGDAIDRAARGLDGPGLGAEAPTGVGYCMALAPRFLAAVPEFDAAFGRGYGEENDWCQKTRALGGRHVAAADLFVEHRGGQSFGSADKQRLLETNLAEIARRYPGYDAEVQDFIRHDPLTTARLAQGLAWAAAVHAAAGAGPVPVYLAHAMGGGAEADLGRRLAAHIAAGRAAVVLRVGQGHRFVVELHAAAGATRGMTDDADLVAELMALLPRRRVIYSCGVGARDAAALPGLLLRLAGRPGPDTPDAVTGAGRAAGRAADGAVPGGPQPVEVLVHDHFPVSPSYTLLGADGVWRGVPRPGRPGGDDPAHVYERPGGVAVPLERWQAAWGRLLRAAGRIEVFSASSRDILAEAYPEARPRIVLAPHRLADLPPRLAPGPRRGGAPVIGVLGNIGHHKGAAVLRTLSQRLARGGAAGLVVVGELDPAYALARPARVHGSYELRDLPGLVARYGITCWLIPSIWPETFSFTTHEALATGLPVFAFDLGAQGEAVARAVAAGAPGGVLPLPGPEGPDPAALLAAGAGPRAPRGGAGPVRAVGS